MTMLRARTFYLIISVVYVNIVSNAVLILIKKILCKNNFFILYFFLFGNIKKGSNLVKIGCKPQFLFTHHPIRN